MSTDTGKEIQFTTEERAQLERNLRIPIQELYAGHCVGVIVPDYDVGKALITGDNPPLKAAIDGGTQSWGIGKLKSDDVHFQIMDFTKFEKPEIVLTEAMSQIPNIGEVDPTRANASFSDFYPGKIMAIIGVESIPPGANVFGLNIIAKNVPTVFITREGVQFEQMNEHVKRAVGSYSNGSYRAKK